MNEIAIRIGGVIHIMFRRQEDTIRRIRKAHNRVIHQAKARRFERFQMEAAL